MREQSNWDEYFMKIANVVSERSSCLRRQVGAVIVKDNHILATGYNGSPTGITHCDTTGCLREKLQVPSGKCHELCRATHAEQNAIIQAAYHGVSINGSTIYITHQPCIICAKMLINAGIKRVVYANPYPDELAQDMLRQSKILISEVKE